MQQKMRKEGEKIMSKYHELTDDERAKALAKAKVMRKARADFKTQITNGTVSVDEILNSQDDPVIGKIKVADVLEAIPGVGPSKREMIMDEIGISENRRIRGLGTHQKEAIKEKMLMYM